MAFDLIPRSFFNTPARWTSLLDNEDDNWQSFLPSSGLTISEDDKNVVIEASVPGIDPEKVDVTFDKGTLWIRADQEETEEDKNKKFYRKASSSFSYRVNVPGNIDESEDPDVVCKNGIMKVSFKKQEEVEPKKLKVRVE